MPRPRTDGLGAILYIAARNNRPSQSTRLNIYLRVRYIPYLHTVSKLSRLVSRGPLAPGIASRKAVDMLWRRPILFPSLPRSILYLILFYLYFYSFFSSRKRQERKRAERFFWLTFYSPWYFFFFFLFCIVIFKSTICSITYSICWYII